MRKIELYKKEPASGGEYTMQIEFDRKKLREIRKQHNLTQEQMAELIDISDRHLRSLETVCTNPSAQVLCRISCVLDIPMDELMIIKKVT